MWHRRVGLGAIACATTLSSGCAYSLPLGGIAVGRGRPIGEYGIQVGTSFGRMPELVGTLPPARDVADQVVNPIPPDDSLTSSARGLDWIGLTLGFTDWLDVGVNFSRGLHAVARVAGGDRWSVSLSPALFRYTSSEWGTGRKQGGVTNLNLTGLASVDPWPQGGRLFMDVYTGAGLSRYGGHIDTDVMRVDDGAVVPSVLMGLRAGVRQRPRASGRPGMLQALGLETVGAWVTQRDGRRDFVATIRISLSVTVTGSPRGPLPRPPRPRPRPPD